MEKLTISPSFRADPTVRVRKKTVAKEKNPQIDFPPGAVVYGKATSTIVHGTRVVKVHGMGGPLTSVVVKKGSIEIALPSTTIYRASPQDKYVAWNGKHYVLHRTAESILETDDLLLIARIDDPRHWSPLHQKVEAYNQISILAGQLFQAVPEALVRQALAEQFGCTPEEVTLEQIRFQVSQLLPYYPAITVAPSVSPELPTPEVERRAKLLTEYKAATKTESNRKIYEAKNSGIHKPEFYKWVKGVLPSSSATAINFERFLRENKPPARR
jgi:hypothetical protein